jgi:hypothetical protein
MTPRKKIAYVQAAWHTDITDRCKQAFTAELAKQSYDESVVDFFSAPGSLEIPLMAKQLAKTGKYAAVCVSGFVVDGGIQTCDLDPLHLEVPLHRQFDSNAIDVSPRRTLTPGTPRRRAAVRRLRRSGLGGGFLLR